MEHRYEIRKPLELSVEIAEFGKPLGRFRTVDVSYSGMFIECPDISVRKDVLVELTVSHRGLRFQIRGIVIHRTDRGIGVMRLDYNEGYAQLVVKELGLRSPFIADEFEMEALAEI